MSVSGLQAGMSGIQRGMNDVTKAANDIVKAGMQLSGSADVDRVTLSSAGGDESFKVSQPVESEKGNNDLAKSLVDLKVGQKVFDASAKVVSTADEMLGTLIDTKA